MYRTSGHFPVGCAGCNTSSQSGSVSLSFSRKTQRISLLVLQTPQPIIKTEPVTFDLLSPFDKTISSKRSLPAVTPPSSTTQSPLLRSLIRTTQATSVATKKDAPLYDLLQNLESSDTSIFSTLNGVSSKKATGASLEQYLSQTAKTPAPKDDYLTALLNADPQQPSEISFIPALKQQQSLPPTLVRSTSTSSESSRIAAIFNDLYNSTSAVQSNVNDDFLSLLDNKEFLEVGRERERKAFQSLVHDFFSRLVSDRFVDH